MENKLIVMINWSERGATTWWAVMLIKIQSYLLTSDFQGHERGSLRSSIYCIVCSLVLEERDTPTNNLSWAPWILAVHLQISTLNFFFPTWFEVLKNQQHLPQIQSSFWISANQLHGRRDSQSICLLWFTTVRFN